MGTQQLPDLSRTEAAIKKLDVLWSQFFAALEKPGLESGSEMVRLSAALDAADAEVGATYGQDTADRNDPQTCARCVRAGQPVRPLNDAAFSAETFVRRMVRQWREQQGS